MNEGERENLDNLINKLLIFANDELELIGQPINVSHFDFSKTGEDTVNFMNKTGISYENLERALKASITRGYLDKRFGGFGFRNNLFLTEEGQGRAISVVNASQLNQKPSNLQIKNINYGPTQIGNYNTQNIGNAIGSLINEIDRSNATSEDKQKAKNLLKGFLSHPIINSIIGAVTTTLITKLGG